MSRFMRQATAAGRRRNAKKIRELTGKKPTGKERETNFLFVAFQATSFSRMKVRTRGMICSRHLRPLKMP
jgi:hypothetical protein